jgi:hypothetical protein
VKGLRWYLVCIMVQLLCVVYLLGNIWVEVSK